MYSILSAIDKKYISSCHDVSEGGIAVCISEMSIGGDIGAEIDVTTLKKNLRVDFKLFSESNTRWIIETQKKYEKEFEKLLINQNTPFVKLGITIGKKLIIKNDEKIVINQDISVLRNLWKKAIWDVMG
jgi:phosphoribosylformylglycinamidine synthase